MAYQATKYGYKYGKPENRPAKITNPNDYGALCKHLTSMLSNKKWLQQITAGVMDFIEKRINEVNRFLRLEGDEALTLPNELARQNAKKGAYSKLFKKLDKEEPDGEKEEPEEKETKSNVQGNNPSTNKANNINTEDEEDNNEEN